MTAVKRDWFTLPEVRAMTGLSRWGVNALQISGAFPHAERANTIWLFYKGDVDKVIQDIKAGKKVEEKETSE